METAIYIASLGITIFWSVWIYMIWGEKGRLPEDSGFRFFFIIAPSSFFLLMILSGWERAVSIRLDVVGLFLLSCVTLLSSLLLWISTYIIKAAPDKGYRFTLIIYSLLLSAVTLGIYLIKFYPPLLIRFTGFIDALGKIDIFSFAWVGMDAETNHQDAAAMLNKILIAFFSYLPVALARFIYISRKQRELKRELDLLKKKVHILEKKIPL